MRGGVAFPGLLSIAGDMDLYDRTRALEAYGLSKKMKEILDNFSMPLDAAAPNSMYTLGESVISVCP